MAKYSKFKFLSIYWVHPHVSSLLKEPPAANKVQHKHVTIFQRCRLLYLCSVSRASETYWIRVDLDSTRSLCTPPRPTHRLQSLTGLDLTRLCQWVRALRGDISPGVKQPGRPLISIFCPCHECMDYLTVALSILAWCLTKHRVTFSSNLLIVASYNYYIFMEFWLITFAVQQLNFSTFSKYLSALSVHRLSLPQKSTKLRGSYRKS